MTAGAAGGGARGGRQRLRPGAALLLLAAWLGMTTVVSATLLARHVMPLPDSGPEDARWEALRPSHETGRWLLVHVLYAGCKCSERIVQHLIQRGRIADVSEQVVWAGDDAALEAKLLGAGFPVQRIRFEDLHSELGIDAVPLFVISSPEGVVRYRGGYTERKQSYEVDDVALLDRARSGVLQAARPIFGCAANPALEQRLDPLDLL